ncbi:MAG: hypothetical protein OSJ72_20090 [Lachnospiraceae bacterium]|nr:hypothetical protein [Lachnospiraceae bacterium]
MWKSGDLVDKYEKIKEDIYERFVFTLNQCGKFLLSATDEVIETCIFEDFDLGIRSDFCDEILEMFITQGWIDNDIVDKCKQLKSLFLNIDASRAQLWNIGSVRFSSEWREVMELSDEIKSMLYYNI